MALGDSASILFRVKADSSQANKELAAFTANILRLGPDMEKALAGLPLAAGAITAALVGIGGAVTAVGGVMLNAAKEAADYGSEIHDAAQKAQESTEVMSALKFAAEQSGSSFEAVTGAVSKFNVVIGRAREGNQEALDTLKRYNITTTDTHEALVQAIKTISEMTDASSRAAAAQELFRDRSGAILPVIESFHGDLNGLIKELTEMGLIMSRDDADAADAFGDSLDQLNKQLKDVWRTIGKDLIPVFLDFSKQLSDWLKDNQTEVRSWAKTIADSATWVGVSVKLLAKDWEIVKLLLSERGQGESLADYNARVEKALKEREAIVQEYDDFIAGRRVPSGYNRMGGAEEVMPGGYVVPQAGQTPSFTPVDVEAQKKAQEAADQARKEAERRQQERLASLSRYYQTLLRNEKENQDAIAEIREEHFKSGEITAEQYIEMTKKGVAAYYAFVEDQINKNFEIEKQQAKNATDVKTAQLQHDQAIIAAKREGQLELAKVTDTINKKLDDDDEKRAKSQEEQIKLTEKLIDTWGEFGKTVDDVLKRANDTLQKWAGLSQEVADAEHQLALANRELQDAQSEGQRGVLERLVKTSYGKVRQDAIRQLRDLDEQDARRHYERVLEDLSIEEKASLERIKGKENEEEQKILIEDAFNQKRLAAAQDFQNKLAEINSGGTQGGLFDSWRASWDDFFQTVDEQVGDLGSSLGTFADALAEAFDHVAQAIGSVIENWVLYGTTGPAVMRKVLAAALASLAAEAAVWALKATALGLFYLATQNYEGAVLAFESAAFWAIVAGVSALAGRAIAGDSFKKQSGSANSRSSGSSHGSTIDQNPTPYSREQQNTYDSGNRGVFGRMQDQYFNALTDAINRHADATEKLDKRISSMPPKEVLTTAIKQSPGTIADAVHKDVQRDAGAGKKLNTALGMT